MEHHKNHFRQILLYYFWKGKSAAQATRKLKEVYGDNALKERQCRNWFTRFRTGDFSLKDEPHTGRPHEVFDDEIQALIAADPHISIRMLGEKLNVHFSTVDRHLQRLGYTKEHNCWILNENKRESPPTSSCTNSPIEKEVFLREISKIINETEDCEDEARRRDRRRGIHSPGRVKKKTIKVRNMRKK